LGRNHRDLYTETRHRHLRDSELTQVIEFIVTANVRTKTLLRGTLFLALCGALGGCLRTTIRSGKMPGDAAYRWENRWHHAFFLGQYEQSGPIEPLRLCPQGWAQLDSELDPLQTAIAIVTLGVYTPSTISVICEADERAPRLNDPSGPSPEPSAHPPTP
jgi:hypothetical protein